MAIACTATVCWMALDKTFLASAHDTSQSKQKMPPASAGLSRSLCTAACEAKSIPWRQVSQSSRLKLQSEDLAAVQGQPPFLLP